LAVLVHTAVAVAPTFRQRTEAEADEAARSARTVVPRYMMILTGGSVTAKVCRQCFVYFGFVKCDSSSI